jgi:mRNA-degrading endonuclease RelE of RelBE toxin-antitoxin system
MAWNLHITGPAQKEFHKLPARDQARVKDALLAMQQDPFSGDIKRLIRTGCGMASSRRQLPDRLRSPR